MLKVNPKVRPSCDTLLGHTLVSKRNNENGGQIKSNQPSSK